MSKPDFSIIIPVWNGSSVILDCLEHVYEHSGESFEVICVDNASRDDSVAKIEQHFPQIRMVRHVVNLGFAGGVNRGLDLACGEFRVLLNQDCLVQPNWLRALSEAMAEYPNAGIAGCTIYNEDGSLNHVGAKIERPGAYGRHETSPIPESAKVVETVTGAMFLIRTDCWRSVGRFDEDFFPGYYEEADYCYRAQAKDYDVVIVPEAQGQHLFSSQEWRKEPGRYASIQHQNRYRFVSKHFSERELLAFFQFEEEAIVTEEFSDQLAGRYLAVHRILGNIGPILERRATDLGVNFCSARLRLLQNGFTRLLMALVDQWSSSSRNVSAQMNEQIVQLHDMTNQTTYRREVETILWERLLFRRLDTQPEPEALFPVWPKLKRLFSIVTGREHQLLVGIDEMQRNRIQSLEESFTTYLELSVAMDERLRRLEKQLQLLESVGEYEFR